MTLHAYDPAGNREITTTPAPFVVKKPGVKRPTTSEAPAANVRTTVRGGVVHHTATARPQAMTPPSWLPPALAGAFRRMAGVAR